jgi:hypothetical protein
MNRDVGKKWIDALRSGEFKQGHGQLKDDKDNYCCLGVLTAIYNEDNPNARVTLNDMVLCEAVTEWAEIKDIDSSHNAGGKRGDKPSLWELNDGAFNMRCHTFLEIADIIEAEMDEL